MVGKKIEICKLLYLLCLPGCVWLNTLHFLITAHLELVGRFSMAFDVNTTILVIIANITSFEQFQQSVTHIRSKTL